MSALKKILFVMQLPPPVHGVSVMNQLIKDSRIINTSFICEYINLATAKDIEDLQKSRFSKYILTLRIIFACFRRMLVKRYDFVYITIFPYGLSFIKDSCIVILCRIFGIRHFLHLHTYGFRQASSRSRFQKFFYRFIFKKAEVICLSKLLVEDFESFFKGKYYILPNGIPQVNFVNENKTDQNPVTILFLSNLIRGKGILVLLDALQILKQKGIPFLLKVAGAENEISYDQLTKLIAEKNLQRETILLGPVFGEKKYEEFRSAGLFVLPTDYDTFGLVLLEAMQFGIPCISTNIGAIPDVLGDGRGRIIESIRAVDLASAIEDLLSNPDKRKEMSERGFSYFNKHFTSTIFEERLKLILNDEGVAVNKLIKKNI